MLLIRNKLLVSTEVNTEIIILAILRSFFFQQVRYEPNSATSNEHDVNLFFYYLEMTKKYIEQSPSYVFYTLFSNFGGTMSLMTGMSAISVIEMSIWFVLFVVDRCYRWNAKDKQ